MSLQLKLHMWKRANFVLRWRHTNDIVVCYAFRTLCHWNSTKTTRNKRNISVIFRTTRIQMAVRLFIYGQSGINIYKSNRFDDAVRSPMNTTFSPVQTFKNTCQFSFFFSFLVFAIFAAFTTFYAPVRVVRFRVHQPVGHILFQHFINRPFEFQFLRLVLSQHFFATYCCYCWQLIYWSSNSWNSNGDDYSIRLFLFLRIVCALIAINLYRYQPHLCAVGCYAISRFYFFPPIRWLYAIYRAIWNGKIEYSTVNGNRTKSSKETMVTVCVLNSKNPGNRSECSRIESLETEQRK